MKLIAETFIAIAFVVLLVLTALFFERARLNERDNEILIAENQKLKTALFGKDYEFARAGFVAIEEPKPKKFKKTVKSKP